jgi:hypothetical protein
MSFDSLHQKYSLEIVINQFSVQLLASRPCPLSEGLLLSQIRGIGDIFPQGYYYSLVLLLFGDARQSLCVRAHTERTNTAVDITVPGVVL